MRVSIHLKTRKMFRAISEERYIHIWPNCNYIVEERGSICLIPLKSNYPQR